MGEQPLFSAKAHVFQIDPATKRNWVPASKHALTVSFFYDVGRSVYRIICVGGTKAIINTIITPNVTFTRTSQKFGQWADSRANAVYGLGFGTEQQLQQFSEQFKECREAARLIREKTQEKFQLSSAGLTITASQVLSDVCQSPPPLQCINGPEEDKKNADIEKEHVQEDTSSEKEHVQEDTFSEKEHVQEDDTSEKEHVREDTTSEKEHVREDTSSKKEHIREDTSSEKEHVKKILSEGSACETNMEAELCTLQENNARLVEALNEATSSIEEWKKQLVQYQEQTEKLREQVSELEAQGGHPASSDKRKEELSQSVEEMEALLKAKDEEINSLQTKKSDFGELEKEREEVNRRMQELEEKNAELEEQVMKAEQTLASSQDERQRVEIEVRKVVEALDLKIFDLSNLRQSLASLLDK